MAWSGEQVRGRRASGSLERGGPHPRGRPTLERGGPRPRGHLALERGRPRPRGRSALERGGTSLEGATGPRARQSFVRAVLCPSSEAEFRSRVPGEIVLVGRWGHQARLCCACFGLANLFMFVFLREKVGFPLFFRGPLWLSLTVAPEHLQGYLLGSRRC
jgi:hypothetical protein